MPGICAVYRVGSTVQVWTLGSMIGQQQLDNVGRPIGEFTLTVPVLQLTTGQVDLHTGDVHGAPAKERHWQTRTRRGRPGQT